MGWGLSGNSLLTKKFGTAREEVIVEWRRLHNEELYDQYSSPYIIRVIESRRMRWAGHVERRGREVHTALWWGNMKEGDNLEDLGRRRWENNIKKRVQETEWGLHLARDKQKCRALANTVLNLHHHQILLLLVEHRASMKSFHTLQSSTNLIP